MSIEETLTRMAEAQERQATAMEAILALLSTSSLTPTVEVNVEAPAERKASTGSRRQAKNQEREDKVETTVAPQPDPEPEPEPETPAEPDPLDEVDPLDATVEETFTEDQVRVALKNYRSVNGPTATMKVLSDHGATGMGDLKPEKYAAVMKIVR